MKNSIGLLSILFCIISTLSFSQETVQLKKDSSTFYNVVQFPPMEAQFPGGTQKMKRFIVMNINYPDQARENGISGKVYIDFIITTNGSIRNVQVVRSVEESLDAEAVRMIKSMPNWIPAEYKGESVASKCRLPITFTLSK